MFPLFLLWFFASTVGQWINEFKVGSGSHPNLEAGHSAERPHLPLKQETGGKSQGRKNFIQVTWGRGVWERRERLDRAFSTAEWAIGDLVPAGNLWEHGRKPNQTEGEYKKGRESWRVQMETDFFFKWNFARRFVTVNLVGKWWRGFPRFFYFIAEIKGSCYSYIILL